MAQIIYVKLKTKMAEINNRKRKLSAGVPIVESRQASSTNNLMNENVNALPKDAQKPIRRPLETQHTLNANENPPAIQSPYNTLSMAKEDLGPKKIRKPSMPTENTQDHSLILSKEKLNNAIKDKFFSSDKSSIMKRTLRKRKETLRKFYTTKLTKIKETIKTTQKKRPERFQTYQEVSKELIRKEVEKSERDQRKQKENLEKLLQKHNKYLERL